MAAKNNAEPKKLYRSEKNRVFGGVAGGLAEYFNVDPLIVRFIFVLMVFGHGIGIVLYLVLWIIVPPFSKIAPISEKTIKKNIEEIKERVEDLTKEVRGLKKAKKSRQYIFPR